VYVVLGAVNRELIGRAVHVFSVSASSCLMSSLLLALHQLAAPPAHTAVLSDTTPGAPPAHTPNTRRALRRRARSTLVSRAQEQGVHFLWKLLIKYEDGLVVMRTTSVCAQNCAPTFC
jgi:hypothetical protein